MAEWLVVKVNPESPAVQGFSTFVEFVALNVVYLITCVPVVTIGAATSALYEVTMRYADEERGNLLRDYFTALRHNVAAATAIFAALGVPVAVLAFASAFWFSLGGPTAMVIGIVLVLATAYVFAALLYGLAQVAAFRNTFRQTLKNAVLLPGAESLRTVGLLLIPLTTFALAVAMPSFMLIIVTVGFSLGAYGSAFLFRQVFGKYAYTLQQDSSTDD